MKKHLKWAYNIAVWTIIGFMTSSTLLADEASLTYINDYNKLPKDISSLKTDLRSAFNRDYGNDKDLDILLVGYQAIDVVPSSNHAGWLIVFKICSIPGEFTLSANESYECCIVTGREIRDFSPASAVCLAIHLDTHTLGLAKVKDLSSNRHPEYGEAFTLSILDSPNHPISQVNQELFSFPTNVDIRRINPYFGGILHS